MKEHFRGVVWPRESVKDKHGDPAYRYVVAGMLVTDRPLDQFEGKNEVVVDGLASCMGLALEHIPTREPKITLGTANSVLTSLDQI